jgi:hypothetical protein
MLRLYHVRIDDLDPQTRFDISGGPNPDRPMLAARMFRDGHYEAVATAGFFSDNKGSLEALWTMTQNGVLSPSWSREPPVGLAPLVPTTIWVDGEELGRRSTMIGDIIELRRNGQTLSRHVADWQGFRLMPLEVK